LRKIFFWHKQTAEVVNKAAAKGVSMAAGSFFFKADG
jgi:hypothetical protein